MLRRIFHGYPQVSYRIVLFLAEMGMNEKHES